MVRAGHHHLTAKSTDTISNALIIRCHRHPGQEINGHGPFIDPLDHGFTKNIGQRLAGKTI